MKKVLIALIMAATVAPVVNAAQLAAVGEVLATKKPEKYAYLHEECHRLYDDYLRVLHNNHIAANAQADCGMATMDSLKGESMQYRESKARFNDRADMTATDAGEDLGAMMQGQFDLIYCEAWQRAQDALRGAH